MPRHIKQVYKAKEKEVDPSSSVYSIIPSLEVEEPMMPQYALTP